MPQSYRSINHEVMTDTKRQYESLPELQDAVRQSVAKQFMVAHEDIIALPEMSKRTTQYVISVKEKF